ncbi:MAG TPA: DUF6489 family protein [Rhizomicrobium sp.]|jgi:hypothetical protein|nr:DUF6489 family protein [Rhizomicrobium sp.]
MKIHVELEMTPQEARGLMGLPDVVPLQKQMMDEIKARMTKAMEAGDMESLMRAWTPLGGREAFDQFQKFLWDGARAMTGQPKEKTKEKP